MYSSSEATDARYLRWFGVASPTRVNPDDSDGRASFVEFDLYGYTAQCRGQRCSAIWIGSVSRRVLGAGLSDRTSEKLVITSP